MSDFLQTLSERRCGRKKAYKTMKRAEAYARKRSIATGEWIQAYKCIDCSEYHIGHATPDQVKAAESEKSRMQRCNNCGKPSNGVFCSRECKNEARRKK